jgi:hypothetical protein
LREECSLRDEVTGERKRLHDMELYALYSQDIVRVIKSRKLRWAGHVVRMGIVAYRVLVGKPQGRRPLERPTRRWEDNIKMDLWGWMGSLEWINLAQDNDR